MKYINSHIFGVKECNGVIKQLTRSIVHALVNKCTRPIIHQITPFGASGARERSTQGLRPKARRQGVELATC